MSEFTEKLNSSELVSNAWDEIDRDQASAGLLIDVIKSEFKDWQPPKPLVEVPVIVSEYIIRCKRYGSGLIWSIRPDRDANELCRLTYDWLFPNGCRLEDGSFPDPFEPDNLVRPDSNNQLKFIRAWIDGYTVEKEQLYTLKHIDLSEQNKNESVYLSHSRYGKLKHETFTKGFDMSESERCHFTQSEIDKLNIGSYEQIEVEP